MLWLSQLLVIHMPKKGNDAGEVFVSRKILADKSRHSVQLSWRAAIQHPTETLDASQSLGCDWL